jgi:hypothetical protein
VTGNNVTAIALAVEHTLQELVQWNGEDGALHWMQSEIAYDVDDSFDLPALRVGAHVRRFFGRAIGVYSYFAPKWNVKGPVVSSAVVAPDAAGVVIPSAFCLFLNGRGGIQHAVNGKGPGAFKSNPAQPMWCSLNAENAPEGMQTCPC